MKTYQLQSTLLIGYFKDVEMELLDTIQLKEYLAVSGKHFKTSQSCTSYTLYEIFFFVVLMKKAT
ncbi:hypothetical protein [Sporosarcina sp. ACRSL]|uniref:hypothetical protein n=1 Tax=Sporosarcina sp. ACRSL TaxID=2918215 RepID=UPI00351CEB94